MDKYARNLYLLLFLIAIIGVIFLVGKCEGKRKAKQAYREDTLKIGYEKRVMAQKEIVREQEKQLRLIKLEKEKLDFDISKLKSSIAATTRTSKHTPKYVPCDTTVAVTDSSYQALKKASETIEKQRDEAIVLLAECDSLSVASDSINNIQKNALEAIIKENDTLIASKEKEAKKSKKRGIWRTIKTIAITIVSTLAIVSVIPN